MTTATHHQHPSGLLYTAQVKKLTDRNDAEWLIDLIASHQARLQLDPCLSQLQMWNLNNALVTCAAYDGLEPEVSQQLKSPSKLSQAQLIVFSGVLLLRSEW